MDLMPGFSQADFGGDWFTAMAEWPELRVGSLLADLLPNSTSEANSRLARLATTHESYLNESDLDASHARSRSRALEILDLLGNATCLHALSRAAFDSATHASAGELTGWMNSAKRVCYLASYHALGLDDVVLAGKGLVRPLSDNLRVKIFAQVMGAAALTGAYEQIRQLLDNHMPLNSTPPENAKSALQHFAQAKFHQPPTYELQSSNPPGFDVKAGLANGRSAFGHGTSIKRAENAAAANLISQEGIPSPNPRSVVAGVRVRHAVPERHRWALAGC